MQWGPRLDGQRRSAHDQLDRSRGQRGKCFSLWLSIRQQRQPPVAPGDPIGVTATDQVPFANHSSQRRSAASTGMALMRFSSMSIATSRTLVPTDTETTSLLMMSSAVEGVSITAGRPVLELGALDLTIALSPHPDSAACCASSLRRRPAPIHLNWRRRRDRRAPYSARAGGSGVDADSSRPANAGPRRRPRAGAVDRSVLIVVVVVVMIGVIGVAAMIASVIGHGIPDCRAPDTAHDRADRTANNSPGNRAPTAPVTRPFWSAKAIWDDAQNNSAAERTRLIRDIETSC